MTNSSENQTSGRETSNPLMVILIIAALAGAGAFAYIKLVKPSDPAPSERSDSAAPVEAPAEAEADAQPPSELTPEPTPAPPFAGTFDKGSWEGWEPTGDAFSAEPPLGKTSVQLEITGNFSGGLINTFNPNGDGATGELLSPEFTPEVGQSLVFSVGGGADETVGVTLLGPEGPIQTWRGKNSESMEEVTFDLSPHAGQKLRIKVFDNSTGGWGHILADNFILK